jgi:hypothetical protein
MNWAGVAFVGMVCLMAWLLRDVLRVWSVSGLFQG